jgi:phosphonopyruvate decarboxylase
LTAAADVLEPGFAFKTFTDSGIEFWAGVPDSLLKNFCAYVADTVPAGRHVIAANEGGAVAMAVGHFLATGKPAVVYMQNSGLGNALNPLISLASPDVYGIPMVLVIGWRGEPGTADEPQHVKQGKATLDLLDGAGIPHVVLSHEPAVASQQIATAIDQSSADEQPYAIVVREDTFSSYKSDSGPVHDEPLSREDAVALIADALPDNSVVVATTGKTSRELYEHRVSTGSTGEMDFLTVGGMGHASQIALGIDLATDNRDVWVLDGDGALLMHLGATAVIGEHATERFKHIVLNNHVHDSVGGQPTPTDKISIPELAMAAGYRYASSARTEAEVRAAIDLLAYTDGPALLEIKVRAGARADLGRPKSTPAENKRALMAYLSR